MPPATGKIRDQNYKAFHTTIYCMYDMNKISINVSLESQRNDRTELNFYKFLF